MDINVELKKYDQLLHFVICNRIYKLPRVLEYGDLYCQGQYLLWKALEKWTAEIYENKTAYLIYKLKWGIADYIRDITKSRLVYNIFAWNEYDDKNDHLTEYQKLEKKIDMDLLTEHLDGQKREIFELIRMGHSHKEIAEFYHKSVSRICQIKFEIIDILKEAV